MAFLASNVQQRCREKMVEVKTASAQKLYLHTQRESYLLSIVAVEL